MQQEIKKFQTQAVENLVVDFSQVPEAVVEAEAMTVESLIVSGRTARQILQELAK